MDGATPPKRRRLPLIKGLAIISTQWPCVPILHPLAIKISNTPTTPPPSTTTYYPIPTIKRIFQHPLPFAVHHATLRPIPTTMHDQPGQWSSTICQPSVTAPPLTTENYHHSRAFLTNYSQAKTTTTRPNSSPRTHCGDPGMAVMVSMTDKR